MEPKSAHSAVSKARHDDQMVKGGDLQVRPIFDYREDRVRAHFFLCFLAAYVRRRVEVA